MLPVFVDNRIKEIKTETDVTFCYVPSKENPADYAIRGLTVPEMVNNDLWWHGPEWLKLIESGWPSWNVPDLTPEELLMNADQKGSNVIHEITNVANDSGNFDSHLSLLTINETKYSSLRKLLCVTVYYVKFVYLRVIQKCKQETRVKIFSKYKLLEKVFVHMNVDFIPGR